jgi:hypothetical protein
MLIRHTLAYLPAQLLSPLLQLTAALYLTYVLGAADYGLAMLIFASQELVFLVCLSWWTTSYLRYGGRWTEGGGNGGGADGSAQAPSRTRLHSGSSGYNFIRSISSG